MTEEAKQYGSALEAAQAAIKADKDVREAGATKELREFLEPWQKKWNCRLVVRPQLQPTENGGMLFCPPGVEAL